ncbi:MAG TPA: hypothetical protein V6C84_26310 [Coleofasciculaceae cyanobacterium]|jgi:hypothetical protein
MAKMFDLADFASTEALEKIDSAPLPNRSYDHSIAPTPNDAANENLGGCESGQPDLADIDDLLAIAIWQPAEPQYCRAICAHYGVKPRTVQKWFTKIVEACPWFTESELRLSDDRYTPLCIELMGDYRASGLIVRKWGMKMAERFADRAAVTTSASEPPALRPEVMPREDQQSTDGDRPLRFPLHLGSSLTLPSIASIISPGNDTAYLMQTQQRLQQFEALQQQVIAQMQQQHEQAQTLNAQYQEATSLSDQLLLQEFQLKGVQLGYTALQLKQQAFKATIQSVEAGTLAVPGKPQTGNEPLPSA